MDLNSKIYVAGHNGLLGAAITRFLEKSGFKNIITRDHNKLDLTNQNDTNNFFRGEKPDYVFMSAAKVGGIQANKEALDDFLYINSMIQCNTIKSAFDFGVKKFCFISSANIYPKESIQPIREDYLLQAPLDENSEGYALAKICGLKLCDYLNKRYPDKTKFYTIIPCNLYGKGDSYDPHHSHVIPALIRRFHEAKTKNLDKVLLWGTGKARREFLNVDDVADAAIYLMNLETDLNIDSWFNIGSGYDLPILDIAKTIAEVVGFVGKIEFDNIHPDGTLRKLLDCSKINKLGWKYKIDFESGIRDTYKDFLKRVDYNDKI